MQKQFAYTQRKGKLLKLCLSDKDGEVDLDLNMYVLIHEITHIYDPLVANTQAKHGDYFWILFSKLIKRALEIGVLDARIFDKE